MTNPRSSPIASLCALISISRSSAIPLCVWSAIYSCFGLARPSKRTAQALAAPDQLGAAETEALPAPLGIFRGSAVKLAIPAFHRLHPKPMPDGQSFEFQRGAQRRARSALHDVVAGHI